MPDSITVPGKSALIFDWRCTLMQVFPQYSGPMADWPQVAEVEGVVEALEALFGRHTMVVASNASDSRATEVWKALRRVGLGEYFKGVFTSTELGGARKPELSFFRQLETVLDRPVYQLVMVGDDYKIDVLGAKAAGWRAIWYNPTHQVPPDVIPLHDAEIDHMSKLPAELQRLALPDYLTCLAWLAGRSTPNNILAHVQLVASIAYLLASWLNRNGEQVDAVLAHRGGLLHDLAKIDSIRAGKERGQQGDHAEMAYHLLMEYGQPELAEIANRHMIYADSGYPRRPLTWEQRLVNYADKLVEGTLLVPIEERLIALRARYPQAAEELEQSWPVVDDLQRQVCERLEMTPQELVNQLRSTLGYNKL